MKKQGIINFPESEVGGNFGLRAPLDTFDGSQVFYGDANLDLDTELLGFDEFTLSYHGLIKSLHPSEMTYEPRGLNHIAVCTEELDSSTVESIMQGKYLNRRHIPDSLQDILGSKNKHSLGYANLARYKLYDHEHKNELETNLEVGVIRGIGDAALRSVVVKYIMEEVSRERGVFISAGDISVNDLEEIICSEEFVTSYALNGEEVEAVVVLADTPSSLPWFSESRLEELAGNINKEYRDIRLAFLALTSPNLRRQRLAPILFDLAFNNLHGDKKDIILCTECSPRSVSYTPFIIARHMAGKFERRETVTERNEIIIYPKTTV